MQTATMIPNGCLYGRGCITAHKYIIFLRELLYLISMSTAPHLWGVVGSGGK